MSTNGGDQGLLGLKNWRRLCDDRIPADLRPSCHVVSSSPDVRVCVCVCVYVYAVTTNLNPGL